MRTRKHCKRAIEEDFSTIELGDIRRRKRVIKGMTCMLKNPGKNVCEQNEGWSESKAFYRMLGNKEVSAQRLQESHFTGTLSRARASDESVFLAIQDTTSLNFSKRMDLDGLGSIGGKEKSKGLLVHSTLMLGGKSGEAYGLLGSKIYGRDAQKSKNQSASARNRQRIEEKESYRWLESFELAKQAKDQLGKENVKVISVADREADIYELLVQAQHYREAGVGLLVRSRHNRSLESKKECLWEHLSKSVKQANVRLPIATKSTHKQKEVEFEVRFRSVELSVPRDKRKYLKMTEPAKLSIVELKSVNRDEQIRWRLLTSEPVDSVEQACQIAKWYALRWQIEVMFRILKSGCKVENRQMRSMKTMKPMITMDLITACYLLSIITGSRAHRERRADYWLSENEQKALCAFVNHKITENQYLSIHDAVQYIAKLGGYLGRKSDPPAGPQLLWQGLQKLTSITQAWVIFSTK